MKLSIEYVPPLSLFPNEYNPNVHEADTFDGLLESIKKFGFTQPIVVDRDSSQIIDGEHRWRCSLVLRLEEVPVVFLELSKHDRMLATLFHNESRGKHCPNLREAIAEEFSSSGQDVDKLMMKDHINKP